MDKLCFKLAAATKTLVSGGLNITQTCNLGKLILQKQKISEENKTTMTLANISGNLSLNIKQKTYSYISLLCNHSK